MNKAGIAQLVERCPSKSDVGGSSPPIRSNKKEVVKLSDVDYIVSSAINSTSYDIDVVENVANRLLDWVEKQREKAEAEKALQRLQSQLDFVENSWKSREKSSSEAKAYSIVVNGLTAQIVDLQVQIEDLCQALS